MCKHSLNTLRKYYAKAQLTKLSVYVSAQLRFITNCAHFN